MNLEFATCIACSHDFTKIQTKESAIFLSFYFHEVLKQPKLKFLQIFTSKGFFVL